MGQEQEQLEVQRSLDLEKAEAAKRTTRLQRILLGITSGALAIVWQVATDPMNQRIVSTSLDNTAKVWTMDGELLSTLPAATSGGSLWSGTFNPRGDTIAIGGDDRMVQLATRWHANCQLARAYQADRTGEI